MEAQTVAVPRVAKGAGLPLTERVLRGLPGPRLLWIALWIGVWPLEILVIPRLFPQSTTGLDEGVAETLTTMYGVLIALWGTGKLARDVDAIGPAIDGLTGGTGGAAQVFRGIDNLAWPAILTAVVLTVWTGPGLIENPGIPAILTTAWGFVAWLPVVVLAWTAGAVLLGLHRLGGRPLHLKPFEADRSLGLRPLGSLAFTPFLILVASVLPELVFAPIDLRAVALDAGILLLGVVLLFASLLRLRRQMLAAKAAHTGWTRGLYAQAVQGVRADASLEGLRVQARELAAAESLERHATAIQEWPFEESILRIMAAILTSVVTAILARLVLSRLGL